MSPPRWFWPVIAACCVVLTLALSYRLLHPGASSGPRWVLQDGGAFESRAAILCGGSPHVCFDMTTGKALTPAEVLARTGSP